MQSRSIAHQSLCLEPLTESNHKPSPYHGELDPLLTWVVAKYPEARNPSPKAMRVASVVPEYYVHLLSASGHDGPELVPVNRFCDLAAGVAQEPGNSSTATSLSDIRLTKVCLSSRGSTFPLGYLLADRPELTPDIRGVQRPASRGPETRSQAERVSLAHGQNSDGDLRQRERPARLGGLGVPFGTH
jgi:hypothetical protein